MNETQIQKVSESVFNKAPLSIERKKIGICNEVYELTFNSESFILRMNQHKEILYGTHRFLPLYKQLQIKTPTIVAEDYSKEHFPFCYHILTKIEGKDLGLVIHTLSDEELKLIAAEVSAIVQKFHSTATQQEIRRLLASPEENPRSFWEEIDGQRKSVLDRNEKSQVLDEETLAIYHQLFSQFKPYFLQLESEWYYDDINFKNVMIHDGKFAGLVDLDFLTKGDYLSAVGTIMSCYYGEPYGEVYLNEIFHLLGLNASEQNIVRLYAILNLVLWTSEAGMKFNSNSTGIINWEKVNINRRKIREIYEGMSS